MGNRVIRTGKRPRRMMESIITFTKTLVMTIRAMEVPVMIVGAMSIRLALNEGGVIGTRGPMAMSMVILMQPRALQTFASVTFSPVCF